LARKKTKESGETNLSEMEMKWCKRKKEKLYELRGKKPVWGSNVDGGVPIR